MKNNPSRKFINVQIFINICFLQKNVGINDFRVGLIAQTLHINNKVDQKIKTNLEEGRDKILP